MTYRPGAPARLASLDAARAIEDPGARIKALFTGDDKVGRFLRDTLGPTLVYAARVAPEVAYSIDDVDRAMQWGFGWELGPFETWDAIGIEQVLEASHVSDPPPLVREALERGGFRPKPAGRLFVAVPPAGPGLQLLRTSKERAPVVRRNAGASLVDLGDDVLGVEFHSKMNAIGGDTIQMLQAGVKEASSRFRALVVGNDAPNFSAGANLMLLLLEAQEGNWDEIDLMVRAFQGATMALKYADVPVVVAPAALTLGGGLRSRAPRGSRAGGRGNLHGAGRSRRRPDPRRRRNEGDAGPRDGGGARVPFDKRRAGGSAAYRAAGVRDDRLRQGVGERARRAAPRVPPVRWTRSP